VWDIQSMPLSGCPVYAHDQGCPVYALDQYKPVPPQEFLINTIQSFSLK